MSEMIPAIEIDSTSGKTDSGVRYIDTYQSENKIYTRRIEGFYQRLRRYTGIPLLLSFLLIPWIPIDGRPAMLFDLSEQKFHIFWMTFWPQDGILLAGLLIIAAFLLFAVTVLVGRVWCGFTCPQTVWTMMFIWAEDKCEGDRNQRIKLDRQPWSLKKLLRKGSKHTIWLVIALITGLTFIGYFYGIQQLIVDVFTFHASGETYFWVLFFTAFTYLNAGWLREQVCKYMCPYARFQSAMYDKDTLLVTYDHARGEQRGPRKSGTDYRADGLGDCIDCSWCVQVCPVDIDIRDGLQYACIDCGLCVDACNSVMDKMGYERGLIRFATEAAMETGQTRIFRPLMIGYFLLVLIMLGFFVYVTATRTPVGVDVVRDRGVHLFRRVGTNIDNVYTVKINNMSRGEQTYTVSVEGAHSYKLKGQTRVLLEEGEVLTVPMRVRVPQEALASSSEEIYFVVQSQQDPSISARQKTRFIGPKK